MTQQRGSLKTNRSRIAILAAAALVGTFAAGCDSRVNVRGPRFVLPTGSLPATTPSGPTVSELRPITGVNGVSLEAVGKVQIAFGAAESLTISAPESVIEQLTSEVVGGRLILGRTFSSYQGQASDIQYDVTLRQLDSLELHGAGAIAAHGMDTDRLSVDVNGVGGVETSGRADRQEIRVTGVGSYVAPTLRSRVTEVSLSGGSAVVWATERLEGWVAAGCTLEYWGNPELSIRGAGAVRQLGIKP